ncbi:MAG: GNAT family N-acetyltransferase [Anaerolineae bacterium]|nr:GNAT family N-acetyltransferase [Anaerolineae bacterium]
MSQRPLTLTELTDRKSDLLLPWLDLYETAFPPPLRLLASIFLDILRDKEHGRPCFKTLLAALDEASLVGMAAYEILRLDDFATEICSLWYFAVAPEVRNRGLGTRFYQALLARIPSPVILIEVEMPEEAPDVIHRRLDERRIAFYRRQGARRLLGVRYLQTVGPHQPLTPMHLMWHARCPFSPEDAFRIARRLFGGDCVYQTGALTLE